MIKQEYQKLLQENKLLKKRINSIKKEKIVKKCRKKQYKVETDSEEKEEQEEEGETESEPEEIRQNTLNKTKTIVAGKT